MKTLSIFVFLCCLSSSITIVSGNSTAGENQISKLNNISENNLTKPSPEFSPTTTAIVQSQKSKVCNKQVFKAAALASSVTFTLLFLLGLTIFWRRRRRTHQLDDEERACPGLVVQEEKQPLCRRFTPDEIRTATNNFDPDLKIGDGGFGRVYKGYIDNEKESTPVAVKVLKSTSNQRVQGFWTEIETLSKLRHPHLVSLIGYCNDQRIMAIVYDYMAHGTLSDHLYGTCDSFLTWRQRLEICVGAARGLVYLHEGVEHGIIHRDVKTTNILLDENWVAKVSDFGLSRLGPASQSKSHVTTEVKGTFGYLDPEYFLTNHLTPRSDVYGFGVVLFEVLCGRPAVNMSLEEEQQSLVHWARHNVKNRTLDQIIDDNLRGEIAPECLKLYGKIADRCCRSDRNRRPKMADVMKALDFALRLQDGAAADEEEEIEIGESGRSDENMSCWGSGNQVILRSPCKDNVVHSCPTVWAKTKSQKMLLRFLSDRAGFKWATQPTSRALRALCFTCSCSLKDIKKRNMSLCHNVTSL